MILSSRSRRTLESSSAKSSDKIFLLDADDRRDDSKAAMYVMKTKNCPVRGGCLLSREKAVKDVKSCVQFCFLVEVYLDLDWSRKN